MILLNCKRCDDILKLSELRTRTCECGSCSGSLDKSGKVTTTGSPRLFEIPWTEYDLADKSGEWRRWRVQG